MYSGFMKKLRVVQQSITCNIIFRSEPPVTEPLIITHQLNCCYMKKLFISSGSYVVLAVLILCTSWSLTARTKTAAVTTTGNIRALHAESVACQKVPGLMVNAIAKMI